MELGKHEMEGWEGPTPGEVAKEVAVEVCYTAPSSKCAMYHTSVLIQQLRAYLRVDDATVLGSFMELKLECFRSAFYSSFSRAHPGGQGSRDMA